MGYKQCLDEGVNNYFVTAVCVLLGLGMLCLLMEARVYSYSKSLKTRTAGKGASVPYWTVCFIVNIKPLIFL